MSTMDVTYKCRCLTAEAVVKVPHRRPDEEIETWFELCLTASIYLDHRTRAPQCRETAMEWVKVPMPESAEFLGGKPKVN